MSQTTTRDLQHVLSAWREDAAVLRRAGHTSEAALRERMADEVAHAAHDYLTWLSETDAMLQSGRSREWLRSRFPEWERAGHAKSAARGVRQYRAMIVPRRAAVQEAAAAGREAARLARDTAA
ncbi:MAG: hypothetical protein HEQ38_17175 [Gemmatimonas sp.]|nr:hypothetical protein [Gemmatimonas sp.]